MITTEECHVFLNYCKTQRNITAYHFKFKNDLGIDMLPYHRLFASLLSTRDKPFADFDFDRLRRNVKFSLKGLRSSRAVHYALEGLSADEICDRIGWECLSTMRVYIRLPLSSIVKLGTYDAVAQKLNSIA